MRAAGIWRLLCCVLLRSVRRSTGQMCNAATTWIATTLGQRLCVEHATFPKNWRWRCFEAFWETLWVNDVRNFSSLCWLINRKLSGVSVATCGASPWINYARHVVVRGDVSFSAKPGANKNFLCKLSICCLLHHTTTVNEVQYWPLNKRKHIRLNDWMRRQRLTYNVMTIWMKPLNWCRLLRVNHI
jgi:hypothetical protein